eukprot:1150900-Pelagomonas_calceolata.AAC.2
MEDSPWYSIHQYRVEGSPGNTECRTASQPAGPALQTVPPWAHPETEVNPGSSPCGSGEFLLVFAHVMAPFLNQRLWEPVLADFIDQSAHKAVTLNSQTCYIAMLPRKEREGKTALSRGSM